jgi:hypothetical protein
VIEPIAGIVLGPEQHTRPCDVSVAMTLHLIEPAFAEGADDAVASA